jgi:putative flippase GtrA
VALVRFGIVGGFATLTHVLVAWLLLAAFPGSSVFLINLMAFSVAFLVSFFGHRHFTFCTTGSLGRFLVAALLGVAVNNSCLLAMSGFGFHGLAAIILAAVLSPLVVFTLSKYWAFA